MCASINVPRTAPIYFYQYEVVVCGDHSFSKGLKKPGLRISHTFLLLARSSLSVIIVKEVLSVSMPVPLHCSAPNTLEGRPGQTKHAHVKLKVSHRRLATHATSVSVSAATKEQQASANKQPSDRERTVKGGFVRPEESLVRPRSRADNTEWFYSEAAQREWVSAKEVAHSAPFGLVRCHSVSLSLFQPRVFCWKEHCG